MQPHQNEPRFDLSLLVIGLLALYILAAGGGIYMHIALIRLVDDFERGESVALADVYFRDERTGYVEAVVVLMYFVCVAAYLAWVRAIRNNLDAFRVRGLRSSASWLFWWHLTPIQGQIRAYQGLQEVWRASDPAAPARADWRRNDAGSRLILVWWVYGNLWAIAALIVIFFFSDVHVWSEYRPFSLIGAAWHFSGIVGAILTAVVVRRITNRQMEKSLLPTR